MLEQVKKMIAMHKDGVKITSEDWAKLEALSEDREVLKDGIYKESDGNDWWVICDGNGYPFSICPHGITKKGVSSGTLAPDTYERKNLVFDHELKTGDGIFFEPEKNGWWAIIDGVGYPFGNHRPLSSGSEIKRSCSAMAYNPKRLKFVSDINMKARC